MSTEVTTPDGNTIALTAGDVDEAVSGILDNGLVASDVNGESVPSGFSRIDAFRVGVLGDTDALRQALPVATVVRPSSSRRTTPRSRRTSPSIGSGTHTSG